MNPQLICDGNFGRAVQVTLETQDNTGATFPSHGTAVISDYASAFVAQVPQAVGLPSVFAVKAKITKAVGDPTETVTATFNMIDSASGIALPAFPISVDLVAPAAASQKATHVVEVGSPNVVTGSTTADPGSATAPATM